MSHDDSRIKRPKLARTSARRSLSALFMPGAGLAEGAATARPSSNGSAEPWNDVITRSVELGYRVIDDYVRQGEQIARTMGSRGPIAGPMEAAGDAQDVARRMTQYAMDFTTLWLQMVQSATGSTTAWTVPPFMGFTPPPPSAWGAAHAPRPDAHDGARDAAPRPASSAMPSKEERPVRVSLSVRSAKPTEVVLDLRPVAGRRRMVAQSLRSPDAAKPRLADVQITGDGIHEPFTLHITVPDDQPAGVYNGIVIEEESGLPVGTVSLRVKDE